MIRWFDDSIDDLREKNFIILWFDESIDDSINDLKEKKKYFHDSMIRRFDCRFERKKFYIFMIRRFDDSISIRRLKDRLSIGLFYSLYFFGSTLNYICVYIEITSRYINVSTIYNSLKKYIQRFFLDIKTNFT